MHPLVIAHEKRQADQFVRNTMQTTAYHFVYDHTDLKGIPHGTEVIMVDVAHYNPNQAQRDKRRRLWEEIQVREMKVIRSRLR